VGDPAGLVIVQGAGGVGDGGGVPEGNVTGSKRLPDHGQPAGQVAGGVQPGRGGDIRQSQRGADLGVRGAAGDVVGVAFDPAGEGGGVRVVTDGGEHRLDQRGQPGGLPLQSDEQIDPRRLADRGGLDPREGVDQFRAGWCDQRCGDDPGHPQTLEHTFGYIGFGPGQPTLAASLWTT
jgi:hypothetical protein